MEMSEFFKSIYALTDGKPSFKIFVNGEWLDSVSKRTAEVVSPNGLQPIAYVQLANKEDLEKAISGASKSVGAEYDRLAVFERAKELMETYKEDFVNDIMLESGKTRELAEGEVKTTIERLGLVSEDLKRVKIWDRKLFGNDVKIVREPIGIIACIPAFNYPLFSIASKIIPALLGGNSAVAKPSLSDPIASLMFAKVLQEAGVPAGALSVLTCLSSELGDELAKDQRIQMITLTGSTATGQHVMSVCGIKRLHLELGGKGSAIVLEDANIQNAAKKILEGALKYSGQRCDAISRVLVVEKVHDELVDELLKNFDEYASKAVPLIDEKAAQKVMRLVEDAVAKGAKILKGGKAERNFVEPTLLDSVPLQARIAQEETFGPVIPVIQVKNAKEAIAIAKESTYALDSCIFGNRNAMKYAKMLDDGSVTINNYPSHGTGFYPFGGNKNSGIGREGVGYSLLEMTRIKTIKIEK